MIAHPTAKYGVGYVTKGFPGPKGVSPLVWRAVLAPVFNPLAAFLTTGGMPPRAGPCSVCPGVTARNAATSGSPRCGGRGR